MKIKLKNKFILRFLVFVLLISQIVILGGNSVCIASQENASFNLSSETKQIEVDDSVIVSVDAKNIPEMVAFEVKVLFDSDTLQYMDGNTSFNGYTVPKINGNVVTFAFTKMGSSTPEKGDMKLCTFTFKGRANGSAYVALQSVKVLNKILAETSYVSSTSLNVQVGTGVQKDVIANVILDNAPMLDKSTGIAQTNISLESITKAVEKIIADNKSTGKAEVSIVSIEIPKVEDAKAYKTLLPAELLTSRDQSKYKIEIKTDIAAVVLPPNMYKATDSKNPITSVALIIQTVDKESRSADINAIIGDRPLIELNIETNENVSGWSNPSAQVSVSIPYTPSTNELKKPEHMVVFYFDEKNKSIKIPNGKYEAKSGEVTFTTTHFSKYGIGYVEKSFSDLDDVSWAKKSIEVLASKGVINGTSQTTFTPSANVTRADFMVLLVKCLALNASVGSNFNDVRKNEYYYEAVSIAKSLGITAGKGNNLFDPKSKITRQEMMTLSARAMRYAGKMSRNTNRIDLSSYIDNADISEYSIDSISQMVKEGLVKGDGVRIKPLSNATRAETAVLMYNIYTKSAN